MADKGKFWAKPMISIDSSKKRFDSGQRSKDEPHTQDKAGGDDQALWDHVTHDVRPLKGQKNIPASSGKKGPAPRKKSVPVTDSVAVKAGPRQPGDQEVDRRTDQKLKRGQFPIDIKLDLHGLTQTAAHDRLVKVLKRGQAQGARCVLVITGKGRGEGQGVLRRKVPEWLRDESLLTVVLRFHTAQPEHGGDGALYVLLKRTRTPS